MYWAAMTAHPAGDDLLDVCPRLATGDDPADR
jgi:hypothetical protein